MKLLRPDLIDPPKSGVLTKNSTNPAKNIFIPLTNNENSNQLTLKIGDNFKISFDSPPEPLWMAKIIKELGELNAVL